MSEEKLIDYEDMTCPKCDSDEFDYVEESNFLANPSVVYFRCQSCDCLFSALRHTNYSNVGIEEEADCSECGVKEFFTEGCKKCEKAESLAVLE